MTSYINFDETTIIMSINESTIATTSIDESSLDELCQNFHVRITTFMYVY